MEDALVALGVGLGLVALLALAYRARRSVPEDPEEPQDHGSGAAEPETPQAFDEEEGTVTHKVLRSEVLSPSESSRAPRPQLPPPPELPPATQELLASVREEADARALSTRSPREQLLHLRESESAGHALLLALVAQARADAEDAERAAGSEAVEPEGLHETRTLGSKDWQPEIPSEPAAEYAEGGRTIAIPPPHQRPPSRVQTRPKRPSAANGRPPRRPGAASGRNPAVRGLGRPSGPTGRSQSRSQSRGGRPGAASGRNPVQRRRPSSSAARARPPTERRRRASLPQERRRPPSLDPLVRSLAREVGRLRETQDGPASLRLADQLAALQEVCLAVGHGSDPAESERRLAKVLSRALGQGDSRPRKPSREPQ